jgi:putative endopeptidase
VFSNGGQSMRNLLKRTSAVILSVMMLAGTSYAADKVPGQKWIDSDVTGNVTKETQTSPADDFALYVNKDWDVSFNPENNTGSQILEIRKAEMKNLLSELIKSGTGTGHDEQLVSTLYRVETDMAERNADGVEPVRKYVEDIRKIRSLDELNTFISDEDSQFIAEPFLNTESYPDLKDSARKIMYLIPGTLSLSDAAEYSSMTEAGKRTRDAGKEMMIRFLRKFSITEEEAKQSYEAMFKLETNLASAEVPDREMQTYFYAGTESYHPVAISELMAAGSAYPIASVLKPYTDSGIEIFNLYEPKWLSRLNELYTQENLEAWKGILLYRLMMNSIGCLDQDCLDLYEQYTNAVNLTNRKIDVEEEAYKLCNEHLDWAVGKMYCDQYISPEEKEKVTGMIREIIEVYRKRLENCDWMSEATREKAVEKLDGIRIHSVYPDDWTPYAYTGLDFKSKEEGGNSFTDVIAIQKYKKEKAIRDTVTPPEGDIWDGAPQDPDAHYSPMGNSINITAGVLGDAFYDPNASESANWGGIGQVIGHEITHAFDSGGSNYDRDGNLNNWWTDADRAKFTEKVQKVIAYYDTFEPLKGYRVNGIMTQKETVADLGSFSCLMELAKTKPDFNYQEFFVNIAKLFRMQASPAAEQVWIQSNYHPPYYLRVNVNLSMLQEFQDTYGVREGDNMYCAPSDRLSVW